MVCHPYRAVFARRDLNLLLFLHSLKADSGPSGSGRQYAEEPGAVSRPGLFGFF